MNDKLDVLGLFDPVNKIQIGKIFKYCINKIIRI